MGDLKGAPAVHFNFPLLSFSLYTTFNIGIAAASEPIPMEWGRFGECLLPVFLIYCQDYRSSYFILQLASFPYMAETITFTNNEAISVR